MRRPDGARAVVIGGGISGLAASALLAREGYSVTLLEQHAALGGRSGSWAKDGFRFDTGPSWYLMPEVFDHFFRLLGTSAEEQLDLVQLDPAYRVMFEHHTEPIDVAAGRAENVALFESIEPGAGKALERYLASAEETYRMAKKRFLYSTFASLGPLLRPDVLLRAPRLLRLLLQPLDRFAAGHVQDPRLRQILGYPAVFLGSAPSLAPSMYHLMSHLDLSDGVLYPRGGFSRIIEAIAALARAEGVTIRTGAAATAIITQSGGTRRRSATVAGVDCTDADGTVSRIEADLVVSAADLHHTETQLLPRALQTYPAKYWSRRTVGPSALLLYLGVRGELPQLAHHTLLFTQDWKENFGRIFGKRPAVPFPASLYLCKPTATDPSTAPPGSENLFVLVPLPADPGLGSGGEDGAGDRRIEELADAVIGQISSWAGIDDLAERITMRRTVGPADFVSHLNSWKGSSLGPAHILSQSAFFRTGNMSKKVEGLFYAGSSTIPGIGLPMCLISAELVIKRLRGDTSTGPLGEPQAAAQGSGSGRRRPQEGR